MYNYSQISEERSSGCHVDLQNIFREVLKIYDHSILCGFRDKDSQEKAFNERKTKVHYPFSKHNKKPSLAIDVAPYPIDWDNIKRFYHFAGFVEGIARRLLKEGLILHKLRWGGDWDGDHDFSDQNFNDLVHFELICPLS